ncbi:MAG: hypothetical protein FWG85_05260 [Bacteroidetes bacterium]|nr:hypothetical protein [Bacteroidota bacterium]
MNNKLMETDRRKKSDGEATAIAKLQTTELLFILTLVFSIILLASCKKDDVIQTNTNTNPLVGEWYEVFLDTNTIVTTQVVFTETHMSAFNYTKDYGDSLLNDTIIWYWEGDVEYTMLSNEEIQFEFPLVKEFYQNQDMLNYLDSLEKIKLQIYIGCSYMGINKTQFTFNGDTLFIRDFIESKYLGMEPIYLIKKEKK